MRSRSYLAVALILLCAVTLPADDKTTLQPKSRAFILRALMAEYAGVKKALPAGAEGLHLKTDGSVDERSLGIQLANYGPAVRPGELAQITKIDFLRDKIKFEINGGGKKKRKWYQNIEISGPVSGTTTGGPEQQVNGSMITLDFGQTIPDLTADQLKEYLGPVLDFSKKSASLVITDTWPPEIQEAVKAHTITAGMSKDQVLASKGRPDNKMRERKGRVEQETWVYGKVPSKVMLVVFENDEVVEATEYMPGVPATKVPRPGDPTPEPPKEPAKEPIKQL